MQIWQRLRFYLQLRLQPRRCWTVSRMKAIHPTSCFPALRLCCDSQIATATDARLTRHRFWNLGSSVSPHSRHFSYQAPDPIKAWHVDNIDLNDIFKMAEGCTETSCVARLRVEDKIPSLACSTFFPREWLGTRQDFPFFCAGVLAPTWELGAIEACVAPVDVLPVVSAHSMSRWACTSSRSDFLMAPCAR